MRENNSESIVVIDEHNLDKECINLPGQYLKYAHQAINQKRTWDEAKARLEVTQAEVSQLIRNNPEKYGLEKVTESGISSAVLIHKRYQEAQAELIAARHAQEMSQAVVSALEHKKRSLTLLVDLHGMGYFSNPKVSQKGKEAVEEMMKRKTRRYSNED